MGLHLGQQLRLPALGLLLDLPAQGRTLALRLGELAAEIGAVGVHLLHLRVDRLVAPARVGFQSTQAFAKLVELDALLDQSVDELAGHGVGVNAPARPRCRLPLGEVEKAGSGKLSAIEVAQAVVRRRVQGPALDAAGQSLSR